MGAAGSRKNYGRKTTQKWILRGLKLRVKIELKLRGLKLRKRNFQVLKMKNRPQKKVLAISYPGIQPNHMK